ncbi:hypothetical protein KUF83_38570 [Streptomyces sp. BV286]|uniref:hypothetical protein n=1 Tax=Streptomyces sp. BV286 TaxID=2849672 RepID=UPI001C2E88FA|nr:hypothetical protein [Streptomyces sp. BV286]MBV1942404.1 hypothetical protein [Streptomyces sp. BV286]
MGKLRYVVQQTFALFHKFAGSPFAGDAASNSTPPFVSLACSRICWTRLKKTHS